MLGAMRASTLPILVLAALGIGAADSLPAQEQGVVTGATTTYSLKSGDVLQVRVWGREEFSGQFQVDETGRIQYPLLGEMEIAGLTIGQVRERLREGLEQLFTRPYVTVTPLFRMAVLGHVNRPGLYTADPTLSVTDVVALAGGASDGGNLRRINLFRSGERLIFDFEEEALAGRTLAELGVRSGDEIVVPRRFFTRNDLIVLVGLAQVALSIAIFINTVN